MLISKVFFYQGKHAFHLYLHIDHKGKNTLMSTVPKSLLDKYFPSTIAGIKYAHIVSLFSGDKLLQDLASKILRKKELHAFFYKDYILNNGRVSLELTKKVIKYQDTMHFFPNSYFTEQTDRVKFFVLNQMYLRKRRHIMRTARFITQSDFDYNYIFNKEMRQEFERLNQQNSIYIELVEDSEVEYVLLLNADKELLMFVSI